MATHDQADDRNRKERSPSFPFIPLDKAIERAGAVADAHKRNATRVGSLGDTWGYAPASSGLQQTVAALKAFGLLEDIGRGQDRRVQLTDLAMRILHDTRPGAKEQAIQEAALKPRLIAEYAEKWRPERPSDHHCVSELHLDRGFTETAAKLFLRVFDDTLSFSNLKYSDNASSSQYKEAIDITQQFSSSPIVGPMTGLIHREKPVKQGSVGVMGGTRAAPTFSGPSAPRAVLPLPEGEAALEIPSGLSRRSFDALKAWIDVMVSLSEKTIQERWYVETYLPNSTGAETAQNIGSWAAVQYFIQVTKQIEPETIFRVIAPDEAKEADVMELRSMGVRTF
jgi:hypothetical protein